MDTPVLTPQERHQLLAVLRELDAEAPAEKRRHPRRKVSLNLDLHILGPGAPGLMSAKLQNVSTQGLGLELRRPLRPGRQFAVHLRFREGGGWLVLCQVRNCTPIPTGFRVGAQFVDRLEDPDATARPPRKWTLANWG